MPSHELLYFDGAGRAEIIRICLTIAKADWKDTRFPGKDWPVLKPTTPLGSVPVLKIDGVDHAQSVALARYAGRLAGWYPEDPLEALVVDEMMESFNEVMSKAPKSSDPEEFKKLREEFQAGTLTLFAAFFEGGIQRNGGIGFSKSPSIADIGMKSVVTAISSGDWTHVDPKFFESYPGIMATAKMVDENESIKAYYASK
jgi:glutathione S-transferase